MTSRSILLTIIFFTAFSFSGYSQHIFKGKLIDSTTGKGIENANIVILSSTSGTTSKSGGFFEIETKKKKLIVVISHLSYTKLEIELSSKTEFNSIKLEKATYQLDKLNIRLGEYEGPREYKKFDLIEYNLKQEERIRSHSEGEIVIVEDQPNFFGGLENLKAFFATMFKYPSQVMAKNLEGTAYVVFDINENGRAKTRLIKILGDDFNDEVKKELQRLIGIMPVWYPAYQQGKPVPMGFVIPITYAANGYGNKK